ERLIYSSIAKCAGISDRLTGAGPQGTGEAGRAKMRRNNWAKLALWCGTLFFAASLPAQATLTLYTPFGGDGFVSQGEGPFPAGVGDNNQRGIAYNPANDHVYV